MSFHNVRLPEEIERGVTGGPGFKTTIITTFSGDEYRNIDWSKARGSWQAGFKRPHEENQAVIDFFYARRGRAYGFRFRDWSDYEVDNVIGMTDGIETEYQAIKVYESGDHQYHRPLTRLVTGMKVFVGEDEVAATVDLDTGIITLPAWPEPDPDEPQPPHEPEPIRIVGEFDVPVRFDTDDLNVTMLTYDVSTIDAPIIEIRDRGNE